MQVHPAQISPSEPFDIFYFVRNHTDATTYYVRGVVYDLRTGDVLATHTLDQAATNPRLFIKTVEAPADPNGYGRNIVAIATVYTDSGFTQKSENYEEQEAYYLVKAQAPVVGGGGVGARTVREIIQEELKTALDALPKPEKLQVPDAPDMSFVDALFGALGALQREVNRIPKAAADVSPLASKLDELKSALDTRPQFERTDLSSLAEVMQTVLTTLQAAAREIKIADAQIIQTFESALSKFAADFKTAIAAEIEDTIQSQEITLPTVMRVGSRKRKTEEQTNPIDQIRGLMN